MSKAEQCGEDDQHHTLDVTVVPQLNCKHTGVNPGCKHSGDLVGRY